MPMFNRGQATIEYMTTYGWVILLVVVGLGTLTYFGLLNPSKLVPEKCSLGSQISCEDFLVQEFNAATSKLSLKVRNNLVEPIRIDTLESLDFRFTFSSCNLPLHAARGERIEITCDIDAGLLRGTREDIPIQLTFKHNATGPPVPPSHFVKGQIYAAVT